jgi:hypothetical protein
MSDLFLQKLVVILLTKFSLRYVQVAFRDFVREESYPHRGGGLPSCGLGWIQIIVNQLCFVARKA